MPSASLPYCALCNEPYRQRVFWCTAPRHFLELDRFHRFQLSTCAFSKIIVSDCPHSDIPFFQNHYKWPPTMATADGAGPAPPSGKREKELYPTSDWKYDTLLHTMSITADLFFREIHPRSSWKVPRSGPVLFVAGPHANQVRVFARVRCSRLRFSGSPSS